MQVCVRVTYRCVNVWRAGVLTCGVYVCCGVACRCVNVGLAGELTCDVYVAVWG